MKDGFIKVAAITPTIKVADPSHNGNEIRILYDQAISQGAKIIVFPELCLSGYTCNDLFYQEHLLNACLKELQTIAIHTKGSDSIIFVGLPFAHNGKLYNVAAAIQDGTILALIPKTHIPNYGEFYEFRHFASGNQEPISVYIDDVAVPMGTQILLTCQGFHNLSIGCEICEDLWTPNTPSTRHALAGANVIVNLSASNETIAKEEYRRMLVKSTSARLLCSYIYASAGEGESTQDIVFGGHNLIAENGTILKESTRFHNEMTLSELDLARISMERRRMSSFVTTTNKDYLTVPFFMAPEDTSLTRQIDPMPFVPSNPLARERRCEEIFQIQAMGLKKRITHTGLTCAIIGLSGGLDSTLALLATTRAFDLLSIPRSNIHCITMPCFGTTGRTYDNACQLAASLGVSLEEIDIKEAVMQHFRDIRHDASSHDITYENSQARERTQILMDIANRDKGLVIGTGDMSELALGWATYNGDHMSMYGINVGIPKTLVRHLVKYYADTTSDAALTKVLEDILGTPVSPELLPPTNGEISQRTEDLVGPYELHDFFLYYMLRWAYPPQKIYRIAQLAYAEQYDSKTILKWLRIFYSRFFSQQFKRSCLPDGPKVGSVAVSPRGDLRMPSDASSALWMAQLDELS